MTSTELTEARLRFRRDAFDPVAFMYVESDTGFCCPVTTLLARYKPGMPFLFQDGKEIVATKAFQHHKCDVLCLTVDDAKKIRRIFWFMVNPNRPIESMPGYDASRKLLKLPVVSTSFEISEEPLVNATREESANWECADEFDKVWKLGETYGNS